MSALWSIRWFRTLRPSTAKGTAEALGKARIHVAHAAQRPSSGASTRARPPGVTQRSKVSQSIHGGQVSTILAMASFWSSTSRSDRGGIGVGGGGSKPEGVCSPPCKHVSACPRALWGSSGPNAYPP